MRTQPQEIIRQLEEDNSRLAKEQVLEKAMQEGLDEFFEGVKMALDPLHTFGVKQVPDAEVDGQAYANSSKINEASKRLSPKPPSFSGT